MSVYRLRCLACEESWDCDLAEMLARLRRQGSLRRAEDPEPELVAQLFVATAARFTCSACAAVGMAAHPVERTQVNADDDWPEARLCEGCQRPIPAERLEALPKAMLCAPCQARQEKGESGDEPDYCPRCGNIRTLRQVRQGIVRYVWHCPSCRK